MNMKAGTTLTQPIFSGTYRSVLERKQAQQIEHVMGVPFTLEDITAAGKESSLSNQSHQTILSEPITPDYNRNQPIILNMTEDHQSTQPDVNKRSNLPTEQSFLSLPGTKINAHIKLLSPKLARLTAVTQGIQQQAMKGGDRSKNPTPAKQKNALEFMAEFTRDVQAYNVNGVPQRSVHRFGKVSQRNSFNGNSYTMGGFASNARINMHKNNLFQQAAKKQKMMRFKNDSSLAHQLNRPQPNQNSTFPDKQLREKTSVGQADISTQYRAETSEAFTKNKSYSISSVQNLRQQDDSLPMTQQSTRLPITTKNSRSVAQSRLFSENRNQGVLPQLNSDTQRHIRTSQGVQAIYTELSQMGDFGFVSPHRAGRMLAASNDSRGCALSDSPLHDHNWHMRDRNRQMRTEVLQKEEIARYMNQVLDLENEIKQLRSYLREVFVNQEEQVVSQSYADSANQSKDQSKHGGVRAVFFKRSQQGAGSDISTAIESYPDTVEYTLNSATVATTRTKTSPNASTRMPRAVESPKRDLKEPSNIHSLYQDLFITDMKNEITSASKEVASYRAQLTEHELKNESLRKENKQLSMKLLRYRSLILESKKENDELFQKIKDLIEQGDMPDSDELLDLFNISREPQRFLETKREGTSLISSQSGSDITFDKHIKNMKTQRKIESTSLELEIEDDDEEEYDEKKKSSKSFVMQRNPVAGTMNAVGSSFLVPKLKGCAHLANTSNDISQGKSSVYQRAITTKRRASILSFGVSQLSNRPPKQDQMIQDFVTHAEALSFLLQSKSVKELLANVQKALRQIFKVVKVSFLFQDKEFTQILKHEGSRLKLLNHAYQSFKVYVPENVKIEDFNFEFKFANMQDVLKGKQFSGQFAVGAVRQVQNPDKVIMFVQMEHRKGSNLKFDLARDKGAFDVIARITSSILDRLAVKSRTELTQNHAYKILNTFAGFMANKKHWGLCQDFEDKFPKLFSFERCALLFIEPANNTLFKFQEVGMIRGKSTPNEHKPMKISLPNDRGFTGKAIESAEVMVVPQGDSTQGYLPEVDNATGVPAIRNMMIGPCFDTEGKLRGLIQLINKNDNDIITENDRTEFVSLCPTVAEIIKQADDVLLVQTLSDNLYLQLHKSGDIIKRSAEQFEARQFQKICTSMSQIVDKVDSYMDTKRKNTLKEQTLAQQVFQSIRETDEQNKREERIAKLIIARQKANHEHEEEEIPQEALKEQSESDEKPVEEETNSEEKTA